MVRGCALIFLLLNVLHGALFSNEMTPKPTKYQAVPFTAVRFEKGFWGARLETLRQVTIHHMLDQCEQSGRLKNFDLAARTLAGDAPGKYCSQYPFDDSDVYKVLEAASYLLHNQEDRGLKDRVDGVIRRIALAQEADGYLYTARTFGGKPPKEWVGESRWSNLSLSHELYNIGHLMEAALAHRMATGSLSLWTVAERSIRLIMKEFGPGKRTNPPGHQEIELALIKWWTYTGDVRYLELARFFLQARGAQDGRKSYGEYSQDHLPLTEQHTAVGHSVRAMYMYSAMADIMAIDGRDDYRHILESIWTDVISSKVYLSGGLGSDGSIEGFGPSYFLPNGTAYAETCASVAAFFWQQRLFLDTGNSRYIDVMERMLYNGILSGISPSGDRFFYANPLASDGSHQRVPWFGCACCPPNVSRLIASLGGTLYARREDQLLINFYASNTARMTLKGGKWTIAQKTNYPWDGHIEIELTPEGPQELSLMLRIPGWALGRPVPSDLYAYKGNGRRPSPLTLKVNGKLVHAEIRGGYAVLKRVWQAGDRIVLDLPMSIFRVSAHDSVAADRGRNAIERGPLVYCLERPASDGDTGIWILPEEAALRYTQDAKGNTDIGVIEAEMQLWSKGEAESEFITRKMTLIPYHLWARRGPALMDVWLRNRK